MTRIVGLDFGTTNSVVGFVRGTATAAAEFLLEEQEPHPSVVWFGAATPVVGREAKARLAEPGSGIVAGDAVRSPKRLLGSAEITEIGGRRLMPDEIVAEVLGFLRADARRRGEDFDRAVLTIPVALDGEGRRQLRSAAHRAGIRIEQFVHEPHAALYGHLREKPDLARDVARLAGQYMLVFDWGGGTLDLTLCRLVDGVLAQVTSHGDNELGGDLFDRQLMRLVQQAHAGRHGLEPGDFDKVPGADARLWEQCELAKKDLSAKPRATVFVPDYLRRSGAAGTIRVDVTRDELEACVDDLVTRGFGLIDRVLATAGVRDTSVALCLATGGMVRMRRASATGCSSASAPSAWPTRNVATWRSPAEPPGSRTTAPSFSSRSRSSSPWPPLRTPWTTSSSSRPAHRCCARIRPATSPSSRYTASTRGTASPSCSWSVRCHLRRAGRRRLGTPTTTSSSGSTRTLRRCTNASCSRSRSTTTSSCTSRRRRRSRRTAGRPRSSTSSSASPWRPVRATPG